MKNKRSASPAPNAAPSCVLEKERALISENFAIKGGFVNWSERAGPAFVPKSCAKFRDGAAAVIGSVAICRRGSQTRPLPRPVVSNFSASRFGAVLRQAAASARRTLPFFAIFKRTYVAPRLSHNPFTGA